MAVAQEMSEEVCGDLFYNIYRGEKCLNEQLLAEIVQLSKDFVFETTALTLVPRGYSGVPLYGKARLNTRPDDLWKIIDILFKLSEKFPSLLFSISTDDPQLNPLYKEAEANEIIPKGLSGASDFNNKVYGAGGVMHVVTDAVKAAHPNVLNVDIVREFGRETRNILLTEAVKQRVKEGEARAFGHHRIGVNLPEQVAYIARQRPDLVSYALQEMAASKTTRHEDAELILEASTRVMVHVHLNQRDWSTVNQVADIDAPIDIISHRLAIAMINFDRKYSNCQNGDATCQDKSFSHIEDAFERERLSSLVARLRGEKLSIAHLYQAAKALITEKHVQLCYNLYQDGAYSSDGGVSEASTERNPVAGRKQMRKKKATAHLGKKRHLASISNRSCNKPLSPTLSLEDFERNPASEHFRSFERALNGYDAYKGSSSERSLGEEEELSMFASRSKNKEGSKGKKKTHKRATMASSSIGGGMHTSVSMTEPSGGYGNRGQSATDDDAFDVSELLDSAPPLAVNDEFDDI